MALGDKTPFGAGDYPKVGRPELRRSRCGGFGLRGSGKTAPVRQAGFSGLMDADR